MDCCLRLRSVHKCSWVQKTIGGGKIVTFFVTKFHSHTARRTGATLMYLAGVDLYDIMKVTGHASPKMLKKYIKADTQEVIEKLTDRYEYFR